jgi:23S rRNA (adenine2503-C2)-methyltransferase
VDKDLKSNTLEELEYLVAGFEQKNYIAGYIFSFIHVRGVKDLDSITPLSKPFRSQLAEQGYYISQLETADKLTDPDGTIKYVFGLPASTRFGEAGPDGNRIESVLLFDDDRCTLCVSTQAGCGMGCVFCATGRLGLIRNLTTGEIVDQINVIANCQLPIADCLPIENRKSEIGNLKPEIKNRISNVVFMGMGEPLANYEAVLKAVRILNHPKGKNIGIRHLTISTCGIPKGIERLADEDIKPRLAISLNAPTDAIRQKLMPITKKYPLERLFSAVAFYQRRTHNRVTFEYVLIKDVNDTVLHARMLIKRLRGVLCNVNLIEYNPHSGCEMQASENETIERFANVLTEAGFETTVRRKMGRTIKAACGQLGAKAE